MLPSLRAKLTLSHLLAAAIGLAVAGILGFWGWQRYGRLPLLLVVGFGLAALGVSASAGYCLSRAISRPLEALARAAEALAEGDPGPESVPEGRDEIARLARAVHRLAGEAARARRTQRDFLINVSHDLQTPLTSIRGFSQAMAEGALRNREGLQRAGQIIHEEAGRMERLVRDLLDLARLEARQVELAALPVRLPQLLQSCIESFAPRAADAGIALSLDLPAGLPAVQGDPDRLEQVFAHLLDNALKYTPRGGRISVSGYVLQSWRKPKRAGPKPHLRASPVPSSSRWMVITVADTGIGIAEDELDRVFERFYRADKARAEKEGVGLGLTIAREIVELHGGSITVSSKPGKGSQFHVALPVP